MISGLIVALVIVGSNVEPLWKSLPFASPTGLRDCVVETPGDVNGSGSVNSADVIYLVNAVFLRGPSPVPCTAAGDVNCTGSLTTADVIVLVNYIFKSGAAPCDLCQLPEWQCP